MKIINSINYKKNNIHNINKEFGLISERTIVGDYNYTTEITCHESTF